MQCAVQCSKLHVPGRLKARSVRLPSDAKSLDMHGNRDPLGCSYRYARSLSMAEVFRVPHRLYQCTPNPSITRIFEESCFYTTKTVEFMSYTCSSEILTGLMTFKYLEQTEIALHISPPHACRILRDRKLFKERIAPRKSPAWRHP